MDATVKMWREDLRARALFRSELEDEYPGWFLDRVLGPPGRGARDAQDPSGGREAE
jgi:hypothetical protein